MPAQQEIVAEVEVLFFGLAGDLVWKPRAQPVPETYPILATSKFRRLRSPGVAIGNGSELGLVRPGRLRALLPGSG